MTEEISDGAKFLGELNNLISKTDLSILEEAKKNVWTRLERAVVSNEPTTLWLNLHQLATAIVEIKEEMV